MDMLFWLLVGHALADYPLQGDWLSKAKNVTLNLVPGESIWVGAMTCHCLIHAAMVLIATGSWAACLTELVMHFGIDYCKCKGSISYNTDQALHAGCKVWYVCLITLGVF